MADLFVMEEKMTLSVVITTWTTNSELEEMALKLAKQVRPMCDELVISEDGNYSKALWKIADKYLVHPRMGHADNLAEGIKATTSEFVACMDSDMEFIDGNLRDLCIPGKVVSPMSVQKRFDEMAGWFFVCPRQFLMEFLPHQQISQGVAEGIDVWTREFHTLHQAQFESSDKVKVNHRHGQSYGVFMYGARVQYNEELKTRKEIDPQRHKARLQEDPVYREMWIENK